VTGDALASKKSAAVVSLKADQLNNNNFKQQYVILEISRVKNQLYIACDRAYLQLMNMPLIQLLDFGAL